MSVGIQKKASLRICIVWRKASLRERGSIWVLKGEYFVMKTKQGCGLSKEGRQREKRCRRKNVKDMCTEL